MWAEVVTTSGKAEGVRMVRRSERGMKERTETQDFWGRRMECWESATVCSFVSLMLFLLLLLKQVHLFSFFGELSISWLFVVLVKYCYITNYSKILTDLKDSNFIHLLRFCNLGRTRQERSISVRAQQRDVLTEVLPRWPHPHGQQTDEDSPLWAQLAYWLGPQFATQPGCMGGSGFSLYGGHRVINYLMWRLDSPRPQRWTYPSLKV